MAWFWYMEKATLLESQRRTNAVKDMILDGESPSDIIIYCDQKYGIKESQSKAYIKKARDLIKEECDELGIASTFWHFRNRTRIMNACIKNGDYNTALNAARDMAKLQKLYESPINIPALPDDDVLDDDDDDDE